MTLPMKWKGGHTCNSNGRYELVLGIKFFYQLDALVLPNENAIVVLDPKCACMVGGKSKNGVAAKFFLAS